MSTPARLAIDLAAFLALLVADIPALTGIAVHEWLSVALAGTLIVHLIVNWDWCVSTASRFFSKMLAGRRINMVIDVALFLAFVMVMVSGVMISKAVLPALGLSVQPGGAWRILHGLSADATLVLFAAHTGMHARWIASAVTRLFTRTPDRSVAQAPRA